MIEDNIRKSAKIFAVYKLIQGPRLVYQQMVILVFFTQITSK